MTDATPTSRAEAWRARGTYFSWSPAGESAAPVNVFHVELGDPDAPVLALVHGFPTCSIDWFEVAERLSPRYRVCMLDFPGFGFSDKPRGWGYSLRRDAELLDHYLTQIVGARSVVMVAHDRGDSVALIHATNEAAGRAQAAVEHLVLSNANIFLPLSNLTDAQRLMLHSPELLEPAYARAPGGGHGRLDVHATSRAGRSRSTSPCRDVRARRRSCRAARDDPVSRRALDGRDSLAAALAATTVPATLIWGVYDTVSPIRVANHVWHEHLMFKPGRNAFYLIPGANHYVQNDRPDAFVQTLAHALDAPDDTAPGALSDALDAPVLVDRSRTELPDAAQLIAQRAAVPSQ